MNLNEIDYQVKIETPLYSTEEPRKVKGCLSNIFPGVMWDEKKDVIKGETEDLQRFKEILEKMHIRDTARSYLKRKADGERCKFVLSKQASCNAKINFSDSKQPLGGIEVNIECSNMDDLIESLTEIGE